MLAKINCKGLTLTELIATIAVIGVFVSAAYSGTVLYKRAKLNSVIRDFHKYDYAVKSFEENYSSYPGDMPYATKIWPQSSNGDGDGKIGGDTINEPESYLAFQHLSLSGLIRGAYSGSGAKGTKIGWNTPRSPYRNRTTYWFHSSDLWGNYPDTVGLFLSGIEYEGYSDHRINIADAYFIDKKIDDYRPYTGKILTLSTVQGYCVDTGDSLTKKINNLRKIRYKLDNKDDLCSVIMRFEDDILGDIL